MMGVEIAGEDLCYCSDCKDCLKFFFVYTHEYQLFLILCVLSAFPSIIQ